MLNQGAVEASQRALAMKTIERNAEAQTRLIDDLLDVAGVITGKLRIDVQPVPPQDVIDAACETAAPAASAKSIRIEARIDPSVTAFAGDPARLQQIVWNLLSNAIKFTAAGGHVRVSVTRDGGHGVITVEDNGAGISPAFLPHVFDRFRQEDSGTRRHHGGLGLGLAIVRSLAELHGGSVAVHSDGPGHGARFVVRLPLARVPFAAAPGAASRAPASASLIGRRALVVDDDPEARELFRIVLEQAGAEVDTASSAAEALERLGAGRYDVLVSDIEMPGGDGWQLGERAAAMTAASGAPMAAVAVSAYTRPEDSERSRRAGYQRHISKPVDPAALVAAIAACFATPDRTPPVALGEVSR
jgi:CheY-like chemotaxis protein